MSRVPSVFWTSLPLGPGVSLICHDPRGLMAFSKPEGVLSHPNEPRDQARSLLNARYFLETENYEFPLGNGETGRAHLLNRLDSATSGVILAAASEELARDVRAQFKLRRVRKIYHAVVFGSPSPPVQHWKDRLAVRKSAGMIRTEGHGNIPAEAKVRVLRVRPGKIPLALIQLEPLTGRSHQLRVQCAQRHLPIVGDATYGDFRANRELARATGLQRLFLHSTESRFEYTWQGRAWQFEARADLPAEFGQVL